MPDHRKKKKDRKAKPFCKVRFSLIQWEDLDAPQETKMTTQG